MDKRSKARELTMQALYQLDVQGDDLLSNLGGFLVENEPNGRIRKLASTWIEQCWQNLAGCDDLISQACIKWSLSRLSPVDKSILRVSVFQLVFCKDIPQKVVINEAIELAKKFSTQQSPSFVNGVLDAVMRKLKEARQEGSPQGAAEADINTK